MILRSSRGHKLCANNDVQQLGKKGKAVFVPFGVLSMAPRRKRSENAKKNGRMVNPRKGGSLLKFGREILVVGAKSCEWKAQQ